MQKLNALPATIAVIVTLVLTGCSRGPSDEELAAKYEAAVADLAHVDTVDSSYNGGGTGNSANLFIEADTSDRADMLTLLEEALVAFTEVAEDDPNVNMALQVIASDDSFAVSPKDLGYDGTNSLRTLLEFVDEHPELG